MRSNAFDLTLLHRLGVSAAQINTMSETGWPPEKLYKRLKEMVDSGLSSEAEVFYDFLQSDYVPIEDTPQVDFRSLFKPLDEFEQKEADWLIQGYVPRGQITTLASDGGIGKTSFWVALAAAVSSGKASFLDSEGTDRKPGIVLFMSTEDSVRIVLKRRLAAAGASEQNVLTLDFAEDKTGFSRRLKFGTSEMEQVISAYRPDLCIFDPLQGFVPQGCNMGDRAAMRDCLAPLITLGEKYGTTFLIICHTNKRLKASGRDRIADSADLWDISRSVLMMGWTEDDGIRYLSQEKSNYGQLQQSILFSIDSSGIIHPEGKTWKRDRDYQGASDGKPQGKKGNCQDWIISQLEANGGKLQTKKLSELAEEEGYSKATLERAKTDLGKANKIRSFREQYGGTYITELTYFV